MPLIKSAPVQPTAQVTSSEMLSGDLSFAGIPVDIYRHFGVEIGHVEDKDVGKLKDILAWAKAKCEEPTMGNVLSRISSLENQLGQPELGQRRYDKMWNWVRLSRSIDDLDKKRESLRKRWL